MTGSHRSISESPFRERFSLLLESRQVQPHVLDVVLQIVQLVEQDLQLQLTEENAEAFVTHLVLALQRTADGKSIDDAPPALMREAKTLTTHWEQAGKLVQFASDALNQPIHEHERGYLTIHLAKLAQQTS